jgi:hypothetical protein
VTTGRRCASAASTRSNGIGNDSAKDRTTIIYVLGASKVMRERQDDPPEDVMAGLRVAGRLLSMSDARLNLRGADLRNTDLSDLPKGQVMLEGANLEGAKLPQGMLGT